MTLIVKEKNRLANKRVWLSQRWLAARKAALHRVLRITKQPSRAAFLVGSGRSGTDIMTHCLAQSLNVKLINEDNPLAFENWRLKKIDVVMQVVGSAGAPVVLLKPIVETMRIKELLTTFPESKALFMFRDYRDAINSQISFFGERQMRAVGSWIQSDFNKFPLLPEELKDLIRQIWKDDQSLENACGIYWLAYNSSYLFLDLQLDTRIRLVNYEMLVMNCESTLRKVCEHLGLKYHFTMIADIYATSVKHRPAPRLHPILQQHCNQTWDLLKGLCHVT